MSTDQDIIRALVQYATYHNIGIQVTALPANGGTLEMMLLVDIGIADRERWVHAKMHDASPDSRDVFLALDAMREASNLEGSLAGQTVRIRLSDLPANDDGSQNP